MRLNSVSKILMTLLLSFVLTSNVFAGAILQYGDTALGVNEEGHLNVFGIGPDFALDPELDGEGYGLWRIGTGDATYPGCLCEGWGVAVDTSAGRVSASANRDEGSSGFVEGDIFVEDPDGTATAATSEDRGAFGMTLNSFTTTASTATSNVSMTAAPDVSISHVFGGSLADDVFQVQVTIENNSTETVGDVVYRRVMDWDVPPTEFSEHVTHGGVEANLEANGGNVRFASDNGFASSDPTVSAGSLDPTTENVDFIDNGAADHGSVFDFAFGDLASGESRTFNIYYGTTATETAALDAINLLGADVYSLGQSSAPEGDPIAGTPATYLFAFSGVGGVETGVTEDNPILPFVNEVQEFVFPEPEPGAWFDPPFVDGFTYTLEGGATFTTVGAPSDFGTLTILDADGNVIGTVDAGGTFDLTSYNLTEFSLRSDAVMLDTEAADFERAFPTFLDWTGDATNLTMVGMIIPETGVPAPAPIALLGLGLIGLLARRSKQ